MKPSKKADYALRAALDLALHEAADGLTRTAEIARRTGAPPKFLEAIVTELRRAGLLESRRGADGGLRLSRPRAGITVGQVWRAVEGPLSAPEKLTRRKAADGPSRAVMALWSQVGRAVEEEVDGVTLEDLARHAEALSNVPDFSI